MTRSRDRRRARRLDRSRRPIEAERPDRRAERAAARERKREKLLEAAIRVVRREGPGVSMEEIAHEAGVTKPIVYRVFGDKEGLTRALSQRFADDLAVSIERAISQAADDRARVSSAIDAYITFIETDPSILRFLVNRGLDTGEREGVAMSGFVSRVAQIVTQALGEALRARRLDSGAAEPWSYAIVGAVHMAGDWWLSRRTVPRERLVEYLTSLVWDGMGEFDSPAADTAATVTT